MFQSRTEAVITRLIENPPPRVRRARGEKKKVNKKNDTINDKNSTYGWVARVNASEMHGVRICCMAHAGFTRSPRIIEQMPFVLSTSLRALGSPTRNLRVRYPNWWCETACLSFEKVFRFPGYWQIDQSLSRELSYFLLRQTWKSFSRVFL